jgi:hypothetical protein
MQLVSVVSPLANGSILEVGTIGNEDMVGISRFITQETDRLLGPAQAEDCPG